MRQTLNIPNSYYVKLIYNNNNDGKCKNNIDHLSHLASNGQIDHVPKTIIIFYIITTPFSIIS